MVTTLLFIKENVSGRQTWLLIWRINISVIWSDIIIQVTKRKILNGRFTIIKKPHSKESIDFTFIIYRVAMRMNLSQEVHAFARTECWFVAEHTPTHRTTHCELREETAVRCDSTHCRISKWNSRILKQMVYLWPPVSVSQNLDFDIEFPLSLMYHRKSINSQLISDYSLSKSILVSSVGVNINNNNNIHKCILLSIHPVSETVRLQPRELAGNFCHLPAYKIITYRNYKSRVKNTRGLSGSPYPYYCTIPILRHP